jgi:hypothetical protein
MASPVRKGIPTTLTLAPDAKELLRVLSPSTKAHGHLVSELIRAEVVRREARREVRQELAASLLRAEEEA